MGEYISCLADLMYSVRTMRRGPSPNDTSKSSTRICYSPMPRFLSKEQPNACLSLSSSSVTLKDYVIGISPSWISVAVTPIFERLCAGEGQGLLTSEWLIAEGRPRRYYRISAEGLKTRRALSEEWTTLAKVMRSLLP